ncbi:hypothetical protein HY643_03070 [Candidatus Woesearchaeota archaeon]|nr:hypothetical protein [Candidatus Woesearchaeota archaeon]
MDKKGFIRTVEAVIAIAILLLFVYTILPKQKVAVDAIPYNVEVAQKAILEKIGTDSTLRQGLADFAVLPDVQSAIYSSDPNVGSIPTNTVAETIFLSLAKKYTPAGYDFAFRICTKTTCVLDPPNPAAMEDLSKKSVFMGDTMIASSETGQNPRIVRFWMWKK